MPPMFTPWNARRRMEPSQPPPTEEDFESPENFLTQLLTRRPALDMYRAHAESTPQAGDFKQGTLAKILTAIAAGGAGATGGARAGIDTAMMLRDRPYMQALQQHGMKGDALRDIAREEGDDIKLRAGMLEGGLDRRLKARNLDEDVRLRELEQGLRARGLDQEAQQIADKREELKVSQGFKREELGIDRTRANAAMIGAQADATRAGKYMPGMGGGRARPETRIPVNQYDDARMMAIEELLAKDPNAQYYFQAEEKGGQPTGNYFPTMKRSRFMGMGSRDLEPGEREAMRVYMEQIEKRAKELAGQSVDLYDRDQ